MFGMIDTVIAQQPANEPATITKKKHKVNCKKQCCAKNNTKQSSTGVTKSKCNSDSKSASTGTNKANCTSSCKSKCCSKGAKSCNKECNKTCCSSKKDN